MPPPLTIRLNEADNVVVARTDLLAGVEIAGETAKCTMPIPAGHKVATAAIAAGEPVRKYNQIIGFAAQAIAPGEHVHTHNVEMKDFDRAHEIGVDAVATAHVPEPHRASFAGIVRADGRVATRNYIGVITTVNCSATVARHIADQFRGPALEAFPNVDGVVALCHGSGCGLGGAETGDAIARTIHGYARHPNFGGVLLLGLGCEDNQIAKIIDRYDMEPGETLQAMTIQSAGGTTATVRQGTEFIRDMLPSVNDVQREVVPVSHLVLGLECGGSDGYSGISANPSLGAAADILVRHGGTAILGETPEIYGAEHLLTRRAVSPEVGEKLTGFIDWWVDYTGRNGGEMNNNPSPGNKDGGLTTILEKSLGAAAKGGTTNLVDVYDYAEPVSAKGFVFMNTPGYDPVSVTGMVAGGANTVCFTTGRGSVFGCKPAPSLKLATNSAVYGAMTEDMDINCGLVVDGEVSVPEMGQRIFETLLKTASGAQTKSEALGFGEDEFAPWHIGAVM